MSLQQAHSVRRRLIVRSEVQARSAGRKHNR